MTVRAGFMRYNLPDDHATTPRRLPPEPRGAGRSRHPEDERSGRERRFPIIGPAVGRFCEILARSIGAKRVFEMGSGFGYSTWWFSRAVGPDGRITHTDGSQALSDEARDWLGKAGVADRVRFLVGDARAAPRRGRRPVDATFCDIDKDGYPDALELARPRLRPGGRPITDNTLGAVACWSRTRTRTTPPPKASCATTGRRMRRPTCSR